jgi:YesN/AraC family two-component response regulator
VVTFQDPVQVIDYLKNKKVDLVITDLMMPEMDGLELHQHIRYIQPELPVIIISANDSPLIMKAAQKAGIKEYLFKPINFNKLLNTVKSLTVPIL